MLGKEPPRESKLNHSFIDLWASSICKESLRNIAIAWKSISFSYQKAWEQIVALH